MKKEYENPVFEIIELDENDPIIMSGLVDFDNWINPEPGGLGL